MAIDPIMLALMRKGGGGGSGVQADYAQNDPNAADYIKNRPGGYYDSWEITWDGEIGDRLVVDIDEVAQMIKVSDKTPTAEELLDCKFTSVTKNGEKTQPITTMDVNGNSFGLTVFEGIITVIHEPDKYFTETGTYFQKVKNHEWYIKSLSHKALIKIPAELTTMEGGYVKSTVLFDGLLTSDMLEEIPV